jgi:predicted site-specific integrase-resolvase
MRDEILMPAQAARIFGCSTKTLWRWARRGLIPSIILPSGHRRFVRSELEAIVSRRGAA